MYQWLRGDVLVLSRLLFCYSLTVFTVTSFLTRFLSGGSLAAAVYDIGYFFLLYVVAPS